MSQESQLACVFGTIGAIGVQFVILVVVENKLDEPNGRAIRVEDLSCGDYVVLHGEAGSFDVKTVRRVLSAGGWRHEEHYLLTGGPIKVNPDNNQFTVSPPIWSRQRVVTACVETETSDVLG